MAVANETVAYDVGDVVRIFLFVEFDGAALDPGAVTLSVRRPDGGEFQPEPTGNGGEYEYLCSADAEGRWIYRWATTLPQGEEEGSFMVRDQVVG